MAPRGSSRGSTRGAHRGRGSRGRGAGRGGANSRSRRNNKRATENKIIENSDQPEDGPQEESSSADEESDLDVSSSDAESDSAGAQPTHSALLQALNTNAQRDEPQRKRRRVEVIPNSTKTVPGESQSEILSFKTFPDDDLAAPENLDDVEDQDLDAANDNASNVSDDDDELQNDPFEQHLSDAMLEQLMDAASKSEKLSWQKQPGKFGTGWKYISATPGFLSSGQAPVLRPAKRMSDLHLKQKLQNAPSELLPSLTDPYAQLAAATFNYQDVLFNDRTAENAAELRKVYCTHAINHALKTRDRVIKNNSKLAKIEDDLDGRDDDKFRDQGFTRPRVLLLLPTRQACSKAIDAMMGILQPEQQENRKRFKESFSDTDDLVDSDKPDDFRELFAGNDDDRFLLGIKMTRKTVKYFSSFYNSDVIIASPLGLHAKITADDNKKRDWEFLSSIEVMIVDQADALIMQNWESVETVFEHLNLEPKQSHGCDVGRMRRWYLDSQAKYYRQTLVFSGHNSPELNALFERSMENAAGKFKISKTEFDGAIMRLGVQVKQTFSRFETASPAADPEARFKFFTTSVLPVLAKFAKSGSQKLQGTLIFIPSYMDFLRVQNLFCYSNDGRGITFDPYDLPCISEYASKAQNARARSLFQNGRHSILLYTGRAHHFYRYKLKGVKRVIMYSLPENPKFYEELVGHSLSKSVSEGKFSPDEIAAQSMFSKYDVLKLERIVGTNRYATMLKEKGDIFEFF